VLRELGYLHHEASDSVEAMPFLQSDQRIDLMVSDVALPGMGGRKLADLARETRPDLKVLFVTGYAERALSRGKFLAPGMDLLTKPFTLDTLGTKIRDMIDPKPYDGADRRRSFAPGDKPRTPDLVGQPGLSVIGSRRAAGRGGSRRLGNKLPSTAAPGS